ncbi:MAG: DUF4124 domain-containing protein [Steroidobacterales bacterium]
MRQPSRPLLVRSRHNSRLARACLMCALAGAAMLTCADAEEVYKTTDASGHVVYSDHPSSPGAQKVTVPVTQADPGEAARIAKLHALEDAEYAQRSRREADEQTRQAAQAKQDADRCSAARNRYANLKDVRRVYRLDADGNRDFYTDEQADAMRAAARQAMEQACGK